jgi:hypothetical protein
VKKALCLAILFAVAAPSAFAQDAGKTQIYYRPTNSQDVDMIALGDLVRQAIDDSRELELTPSQGDGIFELDGPLKITKDAARTKMTVTYEIAPGRGTERSYTATCAVTQMERCADAMVLRAERTAREARTAPNRLF